MKSPLRYQVTCYDCGPTTMTNAIMYLFEREEIPPDLISHIGQCTLDSYDSSGHCGTSGTSGAAIRYFGSWFNELRYAGLLPIESRFIGAEEVTLDDDGDIVRSLAEGAAIVLHVFHVKGHYILLTGMTDEGFLAFDPYYSAFETGREGVIAVEDQPFSHNVVIPRSILADTRRASYSMGEVSTREALIIRRQPTENLYTI